MAATHTPNLNLNKPDRQDYVSVVTDINDNMDKIDEEAGMVDDGIAIVIDGNTAPRAISSGQYLLIKNHSTLATGGYHATANIANGESVTSSKVAADSDGIANALNSNLSTLSANFTNLKNRIFIGRNVNARSITINTGLYTNWQCGLLIANVNGAGNSLLYIAFGGNNTGTVTKITDTLPTGITASYTNGTITIDVGNFTFASYTYIAI